MPKIYFFTPQDNISPKTESIPRSPKKTYRLTNWPDYNQALIQRGAITLWLNEQTLAEWYYQGPRLSGGILRYSDTCIQCALSIKAVLGLAFRQTQGLIYSLFEVMRLKLKPPSYTQLCRRQAKLLSAFEPPQCPADCSRSLHLVVDSTGLKVFGEGDGAARAVEGSQTWRRQATHLA